MINIIHQEMSKYIYECYDVQTFYFCTETADLDGNLVTTDFTVSKCSLQKLTASIQVPHLVGNVFFWGGGKICL
jgi:hypothetical protein